MRSASSTEARNGDTHPNALEHPDWVQNWHAEYDSGDPHPTVLEHPNSVLNWHAEWDAKNIPLQDSGSNCSDNEWMRILMEQVTEKIAVAHQKTTPQSLTKKRKQDMREKTFCSTLHTMQVAYIKLLHEAFADNYAPEIAATVKILADSLKCKLHANCPHRETEGAQLLNQLLTQYQEEFKWDKVAEILESAITHAHAEANKEYEQSKRTKETLRTLR